MGGLGRDSLRQGCVGKDVRALGPGCFADPRDVPNPPPLLPVKDCEEETDRVFKAREGAVGGAVDAHAR